MLSLFEPLEPRRLLASQGLGAIYFDNSDFTGATVARIDAGVNLALAKGAEPAPGIGHTTFSVRWSGLIRPVTTDTYTFTTRNTDGVRLWVNGRLLIDAWSAHRTTTRSETIDLKADHLYDIRLEHFTGRHDARMSLKWNTPDNAPELIPTERLFAYDTRSANIGDYGNDNPGEAEVATLVKSWLPDFITTNGDNNYPDGSASTIDRNIGKYYADYIGNYQGSFGPGASTNRFFPTLGNHDWMASSARPYLNYFTLPGNGRYYDFVRGSIHFFALDSDPHEPDGNTVDSQQAQWLKSGLENAAEPFKIVYFQDPPYSSGAEGNVTALRWPFADWGADMVISGSDHDYERLSVNGTPYIVNGAGSTEIGFNADISPFGVKGSDSDTGAMLIEANEYAMTLQYQHEAGDVFDTITLRSKLDLPTAPTPPPPVVTPPPVTPPPDEHVYPPNFVGPLPFWTPPENLKF